ncbi:MAG: CARDB domain-containing protein, partial [Planctomycetota bacterium]
GEDPSIWQWDDGSDLIYTNWGNNEPGNRDAIFLNDADGFWYDRSSTDQIRAILESPDPQGRGYAGPGPSADYILDFAIGDTVPPRVESVSRLPAQGESTDKLISTFSIDFSEVLDPTSANPQSARFRTWEGHTYLYLSPRSWQSADDWATSMGGYLARPDQEGENSFLANEFNVSGTSFYVGVDRQADPASWRFGDGGDITTSFWASGQPFNSAGYDVAYLNPNNRAWYSSLATSQRPAVIEFDTDADSDQDGIPDPIDVHPDDAANGYSIIDAGADGVFDTDDDFRRDLRLRTPYTGGRSVSLILDDGPLTPGNYRLVVTPSITDVVGTSLDGDTDGVAGDAYVREFSVVLPEQGTLRADQLTLETAGNGSRETATPLIMREDPEGSGYSVAFGYGSQDPAASRTTTSDRDWWSFEASAGDRVAVAMDAYQSTLNPEFQLVNAGGSVLATEYDSGPGSNAFLSHFVIPSDGTYYIQALKYYWDGSGGEYLLRVDRVTGATLESDSEYNNNSLAGADLAELVVDGTRRGGALVGGIMSGQSGTVDRDYFDLGEVQADQTILLSSRLPSYSTLRPVVEIRNSQDQVVSIGDNPSDAVARADIAVTDHYYAVIIGNGGIGTFGQYMMDVSIQPTAELNFSDLVVSQLSLSTTTLASGQTIEVDYAVGNFGAIPTGAESWSDRVVLSRNDRYGDEDDIQLFAATHTGSLPVGESYAVNQSVQLPLGVEGEYFVLARTDVNNEVSEFLFEDNNVRRLDDPVTIARTPRADLVASEFGAPLRGYSGQQVALAATITNQGDGATGDGTPGGAVDTWQDTFYLSSNTTLGDDDDVLVQSITRTGALDANQSYDINVNVTLPEGLSGVYHWFVQSDQIGAVYEGGATNNNVLMLADPATIAPGPFVDLVLSQVQAPSAATSGDPVTVNYEAANQGLAEIATGWTDQVYLSIDDVLDASDVLLGSLAQNSQIDPGAELPLAGQVELPERIEGTYRLIVVGDTGDHLEEFLDEGSVAVGPEFTVTRREEADLVPAITSAPSAIAPSTTISVQYTVTNVGAATTRSEWQDRFYLSNDDVLDDADTLVGIINAPAASLPLETAGQYNQTVSLGLPDVSPGNYFLLVKTDVDDLELESDETNNVAAVSVSASTVDLTVSDVTGDLSLIPGDLATVNWTVRNVGVIAVDAGWVERVSLQLEGVEDAPLIPVANFSQVNQSIEPEGSVARVDQLVTVPSGLLPGAYRWVVEVDTNDTVQEGDESNNRAADENPALAPVLLTL